MPAGVAQVGRESALVFGADRLGNAPRRIPVLGPGVCVKVSMVVILEGTQTYL